MKPFTRLWQKLNLTDDDLARLQTAILCDPKHSPVIQGTGGLRKMRFAPKHSAAGKRDALRVCYAYLEVHRLVILALVYPKSQKDNLTEDEKQTLRAALEQIERELGSG